MPEQNPMEPSTPQAPVSKTTIHMSGLLCDVYGLEELAAQRPSAVSCLWLFHGRTRAKEDMGNFAGRIVSRQPKTPGRRALIAVAFDQRNHGTRLVRDKANKSWSGGNPAHAIDMYGMVSGMVSDARGLMDIVEGYVKLEVGGEDGAGEWKIDQHLVLGVSLGGHSTWQAVFGEERVSAGVVIIGCPDYMALMADRAQRSKLASWSEEDAGASFLGSRDFPADLVEGCLRRDPKGILFGTGDIPTKVSEGEMERLSVLLDARVRGKRLLVCSGGNDRLVPYSKSKPFVELLEEATGTWYKDAGFTIENIVYDGVGHAFSEGMIEDSCRFLLDAVSAAGTGAEGRSKI